MVLEFVRAGCIFFVVRPEERKCAVGGGGDRFACAAGEREVRSS